MRPLRVATECPHCHEHVSLPVPPSLTVHGEPTRAELMLRIAALEQLLQKLQAMLK